MLLWGKLKKGEDIEFNGDLLHSKDFLIFKYSPRKVIIAGDNDRPELLSQACQNANVLIHEATYTKDIAETKGKNFGHSCAEWVAVFAQSIALPNLVLTHFSARYQTNEHDHKQAAPSIDDIYHEAKCVYRGGLYMACDFAQYQLRKDGELVQTLPPKEIVCC